MIFSTVVATLVGAASIAGQVQPQPEVQATVPIAGCELHIFPTNEIVDSSPDYAWGGQSLVALALAAVQNSGSGKVKADALGQMKVFFDPATQIAELKRSNVLAVLNLPADTQIVQEAVLPAPWGSTPEKPEAKATYRRFWHAMKSGEALQSSPSQCYQELYVAAINISKGMGSLQFSASFIYRTFDDTHRERKAFDGDHAVPLQNYVSLKASPSPSDLNVAFKAAFADDFTHWASRRVKP